MRCLDNKDMNLHCTTNIASVNLGVCTTEGTDESCLLVQTCISVFGCLWKVLSILPKNILMSHCTTQCIVIVVKFYVNKILQAFCGKFGILVIIRIPNIKIFHKDSLAVPSI